MGYLLAPFLWFDGLVQRAVDAVVFFLMRRFGWPKSSIRYVTRAIATVAWFGFSLYALTSGNVVVAMFIALFGAVFVLEQRMAYHEDRKDEETEGLLSKTDQWLIGRSPLMKPLMWFMLAMSLVMLAAHEEMRLALCWTVISGGALFDLYLARTPNRPPKVLVPAHDAA